MRIASIILDVINTVGQGDTFSSKRKPKRFASIWCHMLLFDALILVLSKHVTYISHISRYSAVERLKIYNAVRLYYCVTGHFCADRYKCISVGHFMQYKCSKIENKCANNSNLRQKRHALRAHKYATRCNKSQNNNTHRQS